MGYAEAIEQQLRALQFWKSGEGVRAASFYFQIERAHGQPVPSISAFRAAQERELLRAEPFFVHASICDLIYRAVEGLPDAPLLLDNLPTTAGFVWLEKALPVPSSETGDEQGPPLQAFSFQRVYLDPTGELGGWGSVVSTAEIGGRIPDGMAISLYNRQDDGALFPASVGVWPFGEGWAVDRVRSNKDVPHGAQAMQRANAYVFALFAFIKQRVLVSTTRSVLNRAARKRITRALSHEPLVRVIELRRREYQPRDTDEHEPAEWSCQWLVRGHWHRYYTREGLQPRWVNPYVKGPDDKPFKAPRATVYEVVR